LAHRAHSLSKKRLVFPIVLSIEEISSLLDHAAFPKHKAIIATLYGTGMRLDELRHLTILDIDSRRGIISIKNGKGAKDRCVPLSANLLLILRQYWKSCSEKPVTWLFPGRDVNEPLKRRSIQNCISEIAIAAGIKKRVSPHVFRHSFATHLLEQGTNIRVIQMLLGHRSIRTTAIYMHVARNFVNQVKIPLDRLKLK
jgi:integrase/recombinase XerD